LPLNPDDWHRRFTQQAGWTRTLRHHLYKTIPVMRYSRVLEVGCGTGAILNDFFSGSSEEIPVNNNWENPESSYGLDIRLDYLSIAQKHLKCAHLVHGDAYHLPFESGSFDLTLCHYFLLWLTSPESTMKEMHRVTRIGGFVVAFAEPDYGGRIDYPDELVRLGELQGIALRLQGAEPKMGRHLMELLNNLNFEEKTFGVLASQWTVEPDAEESQMEWSVISSDIEQLTSTDELNKFYRIEKQSRQENRRVLYVPTFYAWGKVKK